jgi:hypothetical protein
MNITFTNTIPFEIDPPQPASKFIPEWYTNTDSYIGKNKKPDGNGGTTGTIKRCMPVFDAITAGYIISSPADVYVSLVDGYHYFEWASFNLISLHSLEQAIEHPARNRQDVPVPKWENPWSIKTPKGYSTLFVQPFHRESVFTILPGIVDTDTYTAPINFPMIMNDPDFEGLIPKGTPIAQVIPFRRDTWHMSLGSDKELKEQHSIRSKLNSKFFDRYKTMFWNKKEYR